MDYLLHIAILTIIFGMLATSLNLLAGHTGLLSIAHGAFYGLGAYSSALLTSRWGASFMVGVLIGSTIATLVSFIISLLSLRLRDDYFVLATFAFQAIVFSILNNWMNMTDGPLGIPAIPEPTVLGWHVDSQRKFFALSLGFAAMVFISVRQITSSPFGRVLHAIREDELFAKAYGKNVGRFKITAFVVSASLAAVAGSLYAHYANYIDPTSFTVMESILIISMVIIGGAGSLWGPLVGALVLVTLPEALRFIGLPSAAAANLRQIIYGTLLVVMMMFRPRGLIGKYSFVR